MAENPDRVRERFGALPDVPLPESLWQRVDARRRQKILHRKLGMGAATLALAGMLAISLPSRMFNGANADSSNEVAAVEPVPTQGDIQADVQAIDHALQAAYDRGASDAEIAPMWVARDALLASVRPGNAPARPNRG
jgi:hypothetical protein